MDIDLSCRDWEKRIREGRSLVPDLPFLNRAAADQAIAVFNNLRLPNVLGTPSMGEAGADWFREALGALFGSLTELRERLIRELLILVPKKNFKTTNGAGLMLTALLLNQRPRADYLLIGPTQKIADTAFRQVKGMIEEDPEGFLLKRFHIQEHLKQITDRKNGARLVIRTFGTDVLTGLNPVGALIDELHELSGIKDAELVIAQVRGGILANSEGFLVFITTQSAREPAGVFKAELNQARMIRDGELHGVPMLPILYEFPSDIACMPEPGQDPIWFDKSLWWMVTPSLGKVFTVDRLYSDFVAAVAKGEAHLRVWASQHLNIEIGLALRANSWAGAKHWLRRADNTLTLDTLLARSEVVVIGIDGGGLDDLLAVSIIGRERKTRRWLLWGKAWVHRSVLELRQSEAGRFLDFEKAGELEIVDDLEAAYQSAADLCAEIDSAGLLATVGLDPMGVGAIVDALAERGIGKSPDGGQDRVVGVQQGWTLNGAIKTGEVKLAAGTMVHAGQALMTYAVGNAKAEAKGNAVTITKQNAGTGKIDPLMAALNAIALMSRNPDARGSIFDDPEAYAEAFGHDEDGADAATDWDPAILEDMSHPLFAEHKQRFEIWQDAQPEEEL